SAGALVSGGALGYSAAEQRGRLAWQAATVLALILAGSAASVVSYFSDGMRFDYRPAYARIARDSSHLAVLGWPAILQEHYAPAMKRYELRPNRAYLDRVLATEHDVWAVVSVKRYGIASDEGGVTEQWVAQHCRIVARYERPRFDFRMYRVELLRCAAP